MEIDGRESPAEESGSMFDTGVCFWDVWGVATFKTQPLKALPPERRAAVDQCIARLRRDYEIPGELLSIEQLGRVLGMSAKGIWNQRARGTMPPIPVRRVGGRDMFWLEHVAMWLIDPDCAPEPFPMEPAATTLRNKGGDMSVNTKPSEDAAKQPRRSKEMSAAKALLMERANAEFERRLQELKGK